MVKFGFELKLFGRLKAENKTMPIGVTMLYICMFISQQSFMTVFKLSLIWCIWSAFWDLPSSGILKPKTLKVKDVLIL